MAFYFKGYDNRGFYTHIPSDLAVVELFQDFIATPWDITVPNISYANLAVVELVDTWAGPLVVTTFLDMAVLGPVDDLAVLGVVIADIIDFSTIEGPDVFAGTIVVTVTADFDVTEDDDIWGSAWSITNGLALAVTDHTDYFLGGAFVGYFFLPEQEILYVSSENTVMRVPIDTSTTMRIAAKPVDLEPLDVDTTMITKKRNRSKLQ